MPLRAWLWQSIWLRSGNLWRQNIATPFTPKGAHISQLSGTSYLFVKNTLTGPLESAGELRRAAGDSGNFPMAHTCPVSNARMRKVVRATYQCCTRSVTGYLLKSESLAVNNQVARRLR